MFSNISCIFLTDTKPQEPPLRLPLMLGHMYVYRYVKA